VLRITPFMKNNPSVVAVVAGACVRRVIGRARLARTVIGRACVGRARVARLGIRPAVEPEAVVVGVVDVDVDVVGATVRVTMMSVPTEPSGDSTRFCASVRPSETPMIPMTRPTPAARPSAVTSVRPNRRRSSFHA